VRSEVVGGSGGMATRRVGDLEDGNVPERLEVDAEDWCGMK